MKTYTHGGFRVRVERDSLHVIEGSGEVSRATTFVVRFPRMILAEVNTHRMLSRNSASSRAIPVAKQIDRAISDPFVPDVFRKNCSGMQPQDALGEDLSDLSRREWMKARDDAIRAATVLAGLEVHKELANRLLEPFLWHEAVLTATEWDNFFALRTHQDAKYEFRILARMMYIAMLDSLPSMLEVGQWHLPFVPLEEQQGFRWQTDGVAEFDDVPDLLKASSARCAWVSYGAHDGEGTPERIMRTWKKMTKTDVLHASPFEHQLSPCPDRRQLWGNTPFWMQLRKVFPRECARNFQPSPEEVAEWRKELGI